jgi:hypothetical protein
MNRIIVLALGLIALTARGNAPSGASVEPQVAGDWWQVAGNPDLGPLSTEKQQVVDFAIWQAADGTWQIWSCIRHTKDPGRTRLFHRWEGQQLTDTHWKPMGVAMQADARYGETPGGLQAPYVFREGGRYIMFYGGWNSLGFQTSADGKTFRRHLTPEGKMSLFGDRGVEENTRDPMLLRVGEQWICYYTAHPERIGRVYARTSTNLIDWAPPRVVARYGPTTKLLEFGSECPFVVEPKPGEYYLFQTQRYGKFAHTSVHFSRDPLDFGGERSDESVITTLPIAAPEIFQHHGQWYIAALRADFEGIQIAPIEWRPRRNAVR